MHVKHIFNMEYGIIVLFMWLLLGITNATKVQLSKAWKKDVGWEVTCTWKLYSNDTLQSVRLYNNKQQFMIYRPEDHGPQYSLTFRRNEDMIVMVVDCKETQNRGLEGRCVVSVEMFRPQKENLTFTCEVSGEGPYFIIDHKVLDIEAFVPPSDAMVKPTSKNAESHRVVLNCTSEGVPTPTLVWTIGDQKVPHDFTESYWNVTSKLWQVWSQLSYTPSDENPSVVCTPEVSHGERFEKGPPAEFLYNSANRIVDIRSVFLLLPLLLLR